MSSTQRRNTEEHARAVQQAQESFVRFEKISSDYSKYKNPREAKALKHLSATLVMNYVKDGISFAELDATGQRDGKEIESLMRNYMRDCALDEAREDFRDYAYRRKQFQGRDFFNAATQLGSVFSKLEEAQKYHPSMPSDYAALELTAKDLRLMNHRLNDLGADALASEANNKWRRDGVKLYENFMRSLPGTPKRDANFTNSLFVPDRNGYASLDNPRNWQTPDACRMLLQNVTENKDITQHRTARGATILAVSLAQIPAQELVSGLNDRGIVFRDEQLLDETGAPNLLLKTFMRKENGIAALFTEKNWAGDLAGMKRVYHALPEEHQPKNYMQLQQQLKGHEPSGIGR